MEGEGVQVEEVREGFNGVAEEGRDGMGSSIGLSPFLRDGRRRISVRV